MNTLLVDPPCQRFMGFHRYYFPMGLTYLAAMLKQRGHAVVVYDAEHDEATKSSAFVEVADRYSAYADALADDRHPVWNEFAAVLRTYQPRIVGFSVLTVKVAATLKMARIVKDYDPSIIVIAGGEHVTARPQDLLRYGLVDYVIRGEGEMTLCELVECLTHGGNVNNVQGISYVESGRVIHTPNRHLVDMLDTLPYPDIDSLHNRPTYRPIDLGLMITERGCPFDCTFCGLPTVWSKKVRCHSIERVLAEIRLRQERYGTMYFSFRNGTFTLSRKRVQEFCEAVQQAGLSIEWECLTRVDRITDKLLRLMKEAGCVMVRVGIESGSQTILDSMHKGITIEQAKKAAAILHRSGITWSAYFMVGVPHETRETIGETKDFISVIDPPLVTLAKYTPIPGTDMYREVVKAGLLEEDTTDWTWAVNQNVRTSFSPAISDDEMEQFMKELGEFVRAHNALRVGAGGDRRFKST